MAAIRHDFFVNKNVVAVFDDMVTTIKKVQKMNEYLYEITCDEYAITDLSDEEIIHVVTNEKLRVHRKEKNKSRNIYCKGDLVEKNNKQQNQTLSPLGVRMDLF